MGEAYRAGKTIGIEEHGICEEKNDLAMDRTNGGGMDYVHGDQKGMCLWDHKEPTSGMGGKKHIW